MFLASSASSVKNFLSVETSLDEGFHGGSDEMGWETGKMLGEGDDERVNFENERGNELFEEGQGSVLNDAGNGPFDPSGDPLKRRRRGPSARR